MKTYSLHRRLQEAPTYTSAAASVTGCDAVFGHFCFFSACGASLMDGARNDWRLLCGQEGRLRVLYVAPERLHNETLLSALAPLLPLPLLVVDGEQAGPSCQAHCLICELLQVS